MSARQGAVPAGTALRADVGCVSATAAARGDQPVLIVRPRYWISMLARPADTPRNSRAAATWAQAGIARQDHSGLRIAGCGFWIVDCELWMAKLGSGGDQRPRCARTCRREAISAWHRAQVRRCASKLER